LAYIPLYSQGFGWVIVCIVMFGISVLLNVIFNKKKVTN
jgi:Mg2+ and Co2+ transporter CorA